MRQVPFAMKDDAAEHLEGMLRWKEKQPELAGHSPILNLASGLWRTGTDGRLTEYFPCEHFGILWHPSESIGASGFEEFDLFGFRVFTSPETLSQIIGGRIVLKTVDVVWPGEVPISRRLLTKEADKP